MSPLSYVFALAVTLISPDDLSRINTYLYSPRSLYFIVTLFLGAFLIRKTAGSLISKFSQLALKVGPFRREKKILVLLSGKDRLSQREDLLAIFFSLRPYWWFKGYQLDVKPNAGLVPLQILVVKGLLVITGLGLTVTVIV